MRRRPPMKHAAVMMCAVAIIFGWTGSTGAQLPIKIGVNSEWDYPGGQGVKRGATMAIRDLNAAGGLLERKVEGVYYDNKADIDEAKKATERLLYRDRVDVVCGFWRSDLAIACQPLVMEAKKILLIGGGSTPVITYERMAKNYDIYKYTFTCVPNTLFTNTMFGAQIELARDKLGLNKVAAIYEKAAWCEPQYDYIMKRYANMVVYSTRFSTTASDFSVELAQARAAGADILTFVTTGRGGTPSVKQWYDMKIPALYAGYNVDAQDPNFWEITEGKCDGVFVALYLGNAGFPITSKSRPFREAYKKMFGDYPIAYTNGMTYDIIMAWAEGVKLARTLESDAVVKAMESTKFHYEGVTSVIERWDRIHNPVGGGWKEGEGWGAGLIQWEKGKMEVIWPDKHKTSDICLPERVKKLMGK